MNPVRACLELVRVEMLMSRDAFPTILMVQVLFSMGLILGFGYFIPNITEPQALFLTTGTAAQAVVAVGLVMLPQKLSQDKAEGRLDYMMTLPVSRESYVFSQILFVGILSLPATALAVAFGAWHYDLSLTVEPVVLLVAVLAVLSLAGVGVAMAVLSPYPQLTNMLTQLIIFYVLLFAPVLFPKEYLPSLLRHASVYLPPTYVADALRGSLTDLPGTHLVRSLWVMSGFAAASMTTSAIVIRRRG
jgi:ABC-2 type transport system permease protein